MTSSMSRSPDASTDSPEVRARISAALALVPAVVDQTSALIFTRSRKDDLTSYANEGALTAARSYDAGYGVPFNHWATLKIRGAIVDGLRAESTLSRRLHQQLRAIEAAIWAHEGSVLDEAGSDSTTAEAADARIGDRLAAMASAYAAGALLARDRETLESIEDPRGTPEEELAREETKAFIRAAIAERPEAERVLLERYYFSDSTMVEASGGLSRSWASRLHARAIGGVAKALLRGKVQIE
jgi:RNA polymerase sigma factor for flagellar operon FliA